MTADNLADKPRTEEQLADENVARQRIAAFENRFGSAHLHLACHAALPLVLAPDLLYRLWATFQRDIYGQALHIPWIAVANLLLSGLCREIDRELYQMDTPIRNLLLRQLQQSPQFGAKRLQQLSCFLEEYAQQQLRLNSGDPDIRDLTQVQQWTARLHLDANETARDLAVAYRNTILSPDRSRSRQRKELLRLSTFVDTAAEQLAAEPFEPLRRYARSMATFARGDADSAAAQLRSLVQPGEPLRFNNVILPLPSAVKEKHQAQHPETSRKQVQQTRLDAQNRRTMLLKVREFWIEGVLDKAVKPQNQIALMLEPAHLAQDVAVKRARPIGNGLQADQLLDRLPSDNGRLLLLGEAGSGKTMTLLGLARNLIARAETDATQPIPVVFNLSSWRKPTRLTRWTNFLLGRINSLFRWTEALLFGIQYFLLWINVVSTEPKPNVLTRWIEALANWTQPNESTVTWLIGELNFQYQVPRPIAQAWVQQERLLLLLDGLDEVKPDHRDDCAQAINRFSQEYGSAIAIACRQQDYEQLTAPLNFQNVIRIQPLSFEQADTYLGNLHAAAAGLRQALGQNGAVQTLARTPLGLKLMSSCYATLSPAAIALEVQQPLVRTYVDRMLRPQEIYSSGEATYWLSWLAQKMARDSQTLFSISLLPPIWLDTPFQQWFYHLQLVQAIGLLLTAIVLSLSFNNEFAVLWLAYAGILSIHWLAFALYRRVENGCLGKLLQWQVGSFLLSYSLLASILIPVYLIVWAINHHKFKRVEPIQWSWNRIANKSMIGCIGGILTGGIIGWLFLDSLVATGIAMLMSSFIGLAYGFFYGLTTGMKLERNISPNQQISRLAQTAGIFTLMAWLIWGVIGSFSVFVRFPPVSEGFVINALLVTICVGCFLGWGAGNAAIQHGTLRLVLWLNDSIPWNYARFLDYAVKHNLMRRVGGSYMFVHRSVMEHLALRFKPN